MALAETLATALNEFAASERVIIALDFDGTLSPLVPDPSQARPTAAAAAVLPRLAAHPRIELALVSGRDGQTLAGLSTPPVGTHLIGSHGAEIGVMTSSGFEAEELTLTDSQRVLLKQIRADLTKIADAHEGVWVEDKPAAAALHTRPASQQVARAATELALAGPVKLPGAVTLQGKSVVEIGVLTATKGDALTQLRTSYPGAPALFMGDDVTDERAFAVLNENDVSIKVGDGETAARYRVANPDEVATALEFLAETFETAA